MTTTRFSTRSARIGALAVAVSMTATAAIGLGGSPSAEAAVAGANATEAANPEESASRLARELGRPVEVTSRTTPTTLVEANPDGTFTLTSNRKPVRYQDRGTWRAVDTDLVRNPDGTFSPTGTPQPMTFSGGGDTPLVSMTSGDRSFALRWPRPLPTPTVDGASVTFPDVVAGVDLVLTADVESYRQVLVVKDAQAAANPALDALRFQVQTAGIELDPTESGSISAVDESGAAVFRSPAPSMWDSTDAPRVGEDPSASDPGSGKVTQVGQTLRETTPRATPGGTHQYELTLAPPVTALRGANVRYPVYIDPSMEGARVHFAVVYSNTAKTTLYDTTDNLKVGYCNYTGCNDIRAARSFFTLNIDPLSTTTLSAKVFTTQLNIYAVHNGAGCTKTPVALYKTNGSFSASTDWPGPIGTLLATSSLFNYGGNSTCPANWTRWSGAYLNTYVQTAANAKLSTLGFALRSPDESSSSDQWKRFANNPSITITYGFYPSQATSLAITSPVTCNGAVRTTDDTPELNAKATDNNPSPLKLDLNFRVYTSAGVLTRTGTAASVTSGAIGKWTVSPALPDGTYYFMADAESLAGQTSNPTTVGTASYTFTVQSDAISQAPALSSFDYPQSTATESFWGAPVGGQFTLASNGAPNIAGFAYSWVDATGIQAVPTTTCAYTGTFQSGGSSGGGWITASGGSATLTVPTDLTSGPRTLYVKSFNDAHQTSGVASYSFMIAPTIAGKPASRVEAEDLAAAGKLTQPTGQAITVYKEGPNAAWWANQYEEHIISTGVGQTFTFAFTTTADGNYALGAAFSKANHFGTLQFTIDGQPVTAFDPVTEEDRPLTFDGYSASSTPTYLNLGGRILTAGEHTLTLQVVGKNVSSVNYLDHSINDNGYAIGIDYLRLTPLS